LIDGYGDRHTRQGPLPPREVLVIRGEIEERREGEEAATEPEHALICKSSFCDAIIFRVYFRRRRMPRIVWIILIIVIFGAAMFFLRRYMER